VPQNIRTRQPCKLRRLREADHIAVEEGGPAEDPFTITRTGRPRLGLVMRTGLVAPACRCRSLPQALRADLAKDGPKSHERACDAPRCGIRPSDGCSIRWS